LIYTTLMSNQVLYRKYRPASLKDVRGQDQVIKSIMSALEAEAVAHAYLFAGSRGIGKTSIARILAKEIGTTGNDLYEIDAASNRGIDDVRELREAVNTLPFESKYKVYIIDEVHMLTKEAFNALLKTLEEPPSHVIFILATTEIDRLPETVISRCQVFNFKKPDLKTLKDFVIDTVKKEGYQIDNSAAELVALTGDGSFRDTHGVLEKVLRNSSGEDKKITEDDAFESTGAPRSALVRDIIEAISKREVSKALAKVREAEEQNVSMATLFTLLVMRMRYSMLLRYAPELESSIKSELTDEDFKLLSSIGSEKDSIINSKTLGVFLEMHPMIGKTAIPSLPIELAIIKSISG